MPYFDNLSHTLRRRGRCTKYVHTAFLLTSFDRPNHDRLCSIQPLRSLSRISRGRPPQLRDQRTHEPPAAPQPAGSIKGRWAQRRCRISRIQIVKRARRIVPACSPGRSTFRLGYLTEVDPLGTEHQLLPKVVSRVLKCVVPATPNSDWSARTIDMSREYLVQIGLFIHRLLGTKCLLTLLLGTSVTRAMCRMALIIHWRGAMRFRFVMRDVGSSFSEGT